MRTIQLTEDSKKNILDNLLKRSPNNYGEFTERVDAILNDVKTRGDEAVFEYTKRFDGADINASCIAVTEEEIREAYEIIGQSGLLEIIRKAIVNIKEYHEKQRQFSWFDSKPDGSILGQKITPIEKVGVYVPGGKAAYPSSVLMNIIPAKVADRKSVV